MQGYRQPPPSIPLVTSVGGLLLVLDPETGGLLWSAKLEQTIGRVLVGAELIFLATRESANDESYVWMFDLATGAQRGGFAAGFAVEAALRKDDRVFLSGRRGCMALSSAGQILWRIASEVTRKDAWNGDERELVCQNASGRELWRTKQASWGQPSLIALGDVVAQADFEG
jgi:outer membrane protein assembly factor BamB